MTTRVTSQTGAGTSDPIFPSGGNPFNVGFGAIVSGTATYTIQHTFNNTNWFDHEFIVDATTNQDGNYAFPVAGIRINITVGTGTVTLTTLQAR
ncbi:MAG: hypothetical protein V3S69_05355 [Dehalococcoidales bacterium]